MNAPSSQMSGQEAAYRWFVAAAIAIGVFGGFALAIVLSVDAARDFGLGARWPAIAQVHGHLQVIGFAGLFVMGVAYRLAPRFAGVPLAAPRLMPFSLAFVAGGVILRALGQPFADRALPADIMVTGAWLELAGVFSFAASIILTLVGARRRSEFIPFFLVGTCWLCAQAILGALWVSDLVPGRERVIAGDRDSLLISLQLFGFLSMFVLGVSTRAFPTFFRFSRPAYLSTVLWAIGQVGLLLLLVSGLAAISGARGTAGYTNAGYALLAVGLGGGALLTGFWRPAEGLRPATRGLAVPVRLAMAWLLVAAVYLLAFALDGLLADRAIKHADLDAVRHIVAIGVVMMLILGMANIILPDFAMQRFAKGQAYRRGLALALSVSVVVVLRAGDRMLGGVMEGEMVYRHWAGAGILGLAILAGFTFLLARAVFEDNDNLLVAVVSDQQVQEDRPPTE